MRFAENLVYLRKGLGKKQEDVAKDLGHNSRSRIANYESGNSKPGFDDLLALAEYFSVNIHDLIFRDFSRKENNATDTKDEVVSSAYHEMLIRSQEIRIKNLERLNDLYSTNIEDLKTENENLLSNLKAKYNTSDTPKTLASKPKK